MKLVKTLFTSSQGRSSSSIPLEDASSYLSVSFHFVCIYEYCACVCACVCGASRGQKRALDPLELGLQTVAHSRVGTRPVPGPLKDQQVLLTSKPPLLSLSYLGHRQTREFTLYLCPAALWNRRLVADMSSRAPCYCQQFPSS